jgi:hypothetical protein
MADRNVGIGGSAWDLSGRGIPRANEELWLPEELPNRDFIPRKLGPHGLDLWNAMQAEYQVTDRGGIELLAQVCAAEDRIEALREQTDADGEVVHTRSGPRAHPALRDEIALRAFIVRTIES